MTVYSNYVAVVNLLSTGRYLKLVAPMGTRVEGEELKNKLISFFGTPFIYKIEVFSPGDEAPSFVLPFEDFKKFLKDIPLGERRIFYEERTIKEIKKVKKILYFYVPWKFLTIESSWEVE